MIQLYNDKGEVVKELTFWEFTGQAAQVAAAGVLAVGGVITAVYAVIFAVAWTAEKIINAVSGDSNVDQFIAKFSDGTNFVGSHEAVVAEMKRRIDGAPPGTDLNASIHPHTETAPQAPAPQSDEKLDLAAITESLRTKEGQIETLMAELQEAKEAREKAEAKANAA
jgi:hypothetical protein